MRAPCRVVWLVFPPHPTNVEADATQLAWDLHQRKITRIAKVHMNADGESTSE